ncbi:GTPase Der [Elysia marginata]|uniref:GTPase Der n=1 Tax=Elysia marginata TaxID=1093978 RepID=A0AAV4G4Z1_9GAST|nr:GTPase Der [Elysia marginata]
MGVVAIVGRPNVGKSTLFNRLIQKREAIVEPTSGVTRDRHYGKANWGGVSFTVIDTGGYVANSEDIFQVEIDKQVELAIEQADVILFLVSVTDGVVAMDRDIMQLLRKERKPVLTVINKVDNHHMAQLSVEFYDMGIANYYNISSINGSGTGDLLDEVIKYLPNKEDTEDDKPKIAVVGRPNSGKSSFINTILGQDRYIVTNIAGTTRDSIESNYSKFGFDFKIVDTAGIRRKSKVKEDLEFYAVMRSIRTIEYSDICLLLVDATRGFEGQDKSIFWIAEKNNKGVVILVNKWDLMEKDTHLSKQIEETIKNQIKPFSNVPILFISVLEKQRILKALHSAIAVYENRNRRIHTKKLNEYLLPIIAKNPPPISKGKEIKIKFCMQLPTKYPQFIFFANLPQYIKEQYTRFLENKIRQAYNFEGVPVRIFFRKK